MSRIAKNPIPLPKGVEVNITPVQISVKGPLGTVARPMDPNVGVEKDGETLKGVGTYAKQMSAPKAAPPQAGRIQPNIERKSQ